MSDILSQEQIDALLASDGFGENGAHEKSPVDKYSALNGFF